MIRRTRLLAYGLLTTGLWILGLVVQVSAATAVQSLTESYTAETALQRGMIVQISDSDHLAVKPLTEKLSSRMAGVVVAANDAPVTLSDPNATKQQVYVAHSGRYDVLVSTQNGTIKPNDYLVISSLDGVAMKAGTTQSIVVGRSLSYFDGKSDVSGSSTLKDSTGASRSVNIGLVAVDITISHNPLEKQNTSLLPGIGFLQASAKAITHKTVDPSRLYISVVIFLITTAIAGSIIYSGVRSGIVSIGRNPLAKSTITRGLIQVVLVSVIFFIIGLIGIYLILKL